MNTKKIYFLVILAGSVSAASLTHAEASYNDAAISNNTQNPFTGFHATGAVGFGHISAKGKTTLSAPGNVSMGGISNFSRTGMGFLGWGDYVVDYKGLLLGVEAGASFQQIQSKTNSIHVNGDLLAGFEQRLSQKHTIDAGLTVGKAVNAETVIQFGLGISRGRFQYLAKTGDFKAIKNFDVWGFRPSVGMKVKLSEKVLFDARYQHIFYQAKKIRNLDVGGSAANGTVKPSSSVISFGLTYKF